MMFVATLLFGLAARAEDGPILAECVRGDVAQVMILTSDASFGTRDVVRALDRSDLPHEVVGTRDSREIGLVTLRIAADGVAAGQIALDDMAIRYGVVWACDGVLSPTAR